MQVVIAGGSGFLGRPLTARLQRDGHVVRVLTRRPRPGVADEIAWTPDGTAGPWARALEGVDAVINLSGEGIADKRWDDARKAALRQSRVATTRSLVAAIRQAAQPPRVLVSGSAVGYYGPRGDELVTEATPPGADFLSDLCVEWEREAEQASSTTRVVIVRTGLVMHPDGGALAKMLLPFRIGLGGPLGSGTQYMPWIHLDDWMDLIVWMLTTPGARGAFNGCAPNPVTNAEFTRALAAAVSRPAVVPVPGFGLRLLLGEFAASLLSGQRAIPSRAQEMGFGFRFSEISAALRDLIA
ncbi:MAG TPA: TIGR01777 family oxidoreductase [Vicinamibacterales bacterium]|nr:TIGR01777 family oxidoreductase [Vicinamibacterales bacterium]